MNGNRDKNTVIVGSRKSQLALIQTRFVISSLKEQYPEKNFEIVAMSTLGDAVQDRPLPKIGEKSVFTRELEAALDTQQVDLVVHSLKDLPTALPGGLSIGAVLCRDDARDAVVLAPRHAHLMSREAGSSPPGPAHSLRGLPAGSVIGTSSLRRAAQLQRCHPDLKVTSIRGNLNTRLAKLDKEEGEFDAIVLAAAGLERMGWSQRVSETLPEDEMLYAVGQGALAVECREDDFASLRLLESLHHVATALRVLAERSFLRTLEGGCSAPVAVISRLEDGMLTLTGAVWSLDGKETLRHTMATPIEYRDDMEPPKKCPYRTPRLFCSMSPVSAGHVDLEAAETLGDRVARALIDRGALRIMAAAKSTYLAKTFMPTIEVPASATFQPVLDFGSGLPKAGRPDAARLFRFGADKAPLPEGEGSKAGGDEASESEESKAQEAVV